MKPLLTLVLCILCMPLSAQTLQPLSYANLRSVDPVAEAAKNAVQVHVPNGNSVSSGGSGVYLGDRYVATAAHVMRGETGPSTVTFQDGSRMRGKTVLKDTTYDMAVIELDQEHPTLQGVEFARDNPARGETVHSVGFARGFRIFSGPVVGSMTPMSGGSADWFEHKNPAISGDSGGPTFNEMGCYVGPLWGAGDGNTVGSNAGRFQVFVKPLFPRLAQWRANRIGNQIIIQPQPGPNTTILPSLVGTNQQQYCPPGVICQPAPRDSGYSGYMPAQPRPTPVQPQQPTQPAQPPVVDYDKLADSLIAKMGDDSRFRGPQGAPGVPGTPGPPGDRGPQGMAGRDGLAGQVDDAHIAAITKSILTAMANDDRFKGPKGDDGKIVSTPTKPTDADSRWLYFTSATCKECDKTDVMISALKQKGAPITVITLSEKDAETKGVPMVYVPATDRRVVGLSNVVSYLSLVTY